MRNYDREIQELIYERERVEKFLAMMPEGIDPYLLVRYSTPRKEFCVIYKVFSLAEMIAIYKWYLGHGYVAECEKRSGFFVSFVGRNAPVECPSDKVEPVTPFRIEMQKAMGYNVNRMVFECEVKDIRFSVTAEMEWNQQLCEAWLNIITVNDSIRGHSLVSTLKGYTYGKWATGTPMTSTPIYYLYWPYGTDINDIL